MSAQSLPLPGGPFSLPPSGSLSTKTSSNSTINREALNKDIAKSIELRRSVTHGRNTPAAPENATGEGDGSGSLSKLSCLGTPPVSGVRRMSVSDATRNYTTREGTRSVVPQLADLFAGGMPRLRSRGGTDTREFWSSPNISSSDPLRPDKFSVPLRTPVFRPTMAPTASSPSILAPTKQSRSTSPLRIVPFPPLSPSLAPTRSSREKLDSLPLIAPPPIPLPLPTNSTSSLSVINPALVAARKATRFLTPSSPIPPAVPFSRPPPPLPSPSVRNYDDPSSFTLESSGRRSASGRLVIDDSRWRFKWEKDLPEPRVWVGVRKAYKSGGRGSSVPLDLNILGQKPKNEDFVCVG